MEVQKRMQANKLKAPVECVGYAIVGEENRLPGLLDHAPIREIGSTTGQIASGV